MGQYRLDEAGVTSVASSLVDDPDTLHAQALEVSRAVLDATCGVGGECPTLRHTLERLRLLGAHSLDVLAEAAAALGGSLLTIAHDAQALERAVWQAYVDRPYRTGAAE